ncbi:TM2 domain-containing protein [Arthrobacter sp. ISL-28]|uniref:TM2 domain-containing protein n=1 Tax=Arthrobacter sp. ISL-28 TaxID=2819108 RepID=UPI001BE850A4|nr:TM2 domain-containing protein [Arthrobacter sp. ISL-28]MBT2519737.1 NINE protein [Arthrobacter sp. ISL-28]
MTQSNAEQPPAPSEAEAPMTARPGSHAVSQPASNPLAEAQAPATLPVQSFDPSQPPMPAQRHGLPAHLAQQQPPAPTNHQNYPTPPQYQTPSPSYQGQSQYPQMSQQPPMPNPAYGYPQPKSKLAAGLLGIFLGGLGIHRFYLGYTTIGIIQIVLTVFLGIFTFGLVGLWGFIEGIMILAGANYFRQDAKGIPLRD